METWKGVMVSIQPLEKFKEYRRLEPLSTQVAVPTFCNPDIITVFAGVIKAMYTLSITLVSSLQ
jgi:hypothetical protein